MVGGGGHSKGVQILKLNLGNSYLAFHGDEVASGFESPVDDKEPITGVRSPLLKDPCSFSTR